MPAVPVPAGSNDHPGAAAPGPDAGICPGQIPDSTAGPGERTGRGTGGTRAAAASV